MAKRKPPKAGPLHEPADGGQPNFRSLLGACPQVTVPPVNVRVLEEGYVAGNPALADFWFGSHGIRPVLGVYSFPKVIATKENESCTLRQKSNAPDGI